MLKHKRIRSRGKRSLSRVFAKLEKGDKVALIHDLSNTACFPERYHGKTGTVIGYQGRAVIVELYDGDKKKKFVVKKIHLKKLSS